MHPIVREELELLERVLRALDEPEPDARSSEAALVEELARLRELLVERQEEKDRPALLDQWHRQAALLEQLRRARRSARVELGLASSAFGSTRDGVVLNAALQAGADFGEERLWLGALDTSGRIEGGSLVNARLALNNRFYLRHSEHRVSYASLTATLASNLDPEEQLLLGGDNGLRGFPLRYQAGTASALLTFEERLYTPWQPLKLFDVGAALFVDAGRTWGSSTLAAQPAGWLADAGFGLRLGSARSALGNVLHVDIAFPLNGPAGIDQVQLLIETRKSF